MFTLLKAFWKFLLIILFFGLLITDGKLWKQSWLCTHTLLNCIYQYFGLYCCRNHWQPVLYKVLVTYINLIWTSVAFQYPRVFRKVEFPCLFLSYSYSVIFFVYCISSDFFEMLTSCSCGLLWKLSNRRCKKKAVLEMKANTPISQSHSSFSFPVYQMMCSIFQTDVCIASFLSSQFKTIFRSCGYWLYCYY